MLGLAYVGIRILAGTDAGRATGSRCWPRCSSPSPPGMWPTASRWTPRGSTPSWPPPSPWPNRRPGHHGQGSGHPKTRGPEDPHGARGPGPAAGLPGIHLASRPGGYDQAALLVQSLCLLVFSMVVVWTETRRHRGLRYASIPAGLGLLGLVLVPALGAHAAHRRLAAGAAVGRKHCRHPVGAAGRRCPGRRMAQSRRASLPRGAHGVGGALLGRPAGASGPPRRGMADRGPGSWVRPVPPSLPPPGASRCCWPGPRRCCSWPPCAGLGTSTNWPGSPAANRWTPCSHWGHCVVLLIMAVFGGRFGAERRRGPALPAGNRLGPPMPACFLPRRWRHWPWAGCWAGRRAGPARLRRGSDAAGCGLRRGGARGPGTPARTRVRGRRPGGRQSSTGAGGLRRGDRQLCGVLLLGHRARRCWPPTNSAQARKERDSGAGCSGRGALAQRGRDNRFLQPHPAIGGAVSFTALLVFGLLANRKIFTIWGGLGVAIAVLWFLRGFTFLLLLLIAVGLIALALWRLGKMNKGTALHEAPGTGLSGPRAGTEGIRGQRCLRSPRGAARIRAASPRRMERVRRCRAMTRAKTMGRCRRQACRG